MKRVNFIRACVLALLVHAASSRMVFGQKTDIERQALAERRRLAEELRQAMNRRKSSLPPMPRTAAQIAKNPGAGGTLNFAERNTIRVTKNRAYFNVGVPPVPTPLAKADRSGYYVWRWTVNAPTPFSIVLAADSAMQTGNVDDILNNSRVRRCANVRETSAQACIDSVEAVVQQRWDSFRIEVKDTAILNAIGRTRPELARLVIYEPTGRARSSPVKVKYESLPKAVPRK